jgi:hypothetical protein
VVVTALFESCGIECGMSLFEDLGKYEDWILFSVCLLTHKKTANTVRTTPENTNAVVFTSMKIFLHRNLRFSRCRLKSTTNCPFSKISKISPNQMGTVYHGAVHKT